MAEDQTPTGPLPEKPVKPPLWRRLMPGRYRKSQPVVAVVRLSGAIGAITPLRPGLSLAGVATTLERAFTMKRAAAVAIALNSPGGSPVQSALIFRRIRALAEENRLPVFVFAEDVAASGGYMLACAGDEIYADESSVIGSIGVVSAGFGFDKFIRKYGIERRVHTQGRNKAMLDPFRPEKPDDVKRLLGLQKDVHESFIALVRARREGRLPKKDASLFTGEFWSGARALEFGLIDGLGDLRTVMRAKLGDKTRFKLVGAKSGWLQRRLGRVPGTALGADWLDGLGGAFASDLIAAIEERALWSRYGL